MRKLISKSNGLFGCVFVLKDNERANELLNCGHTDPGDCGLFGMRTSLLCKFVSIFFSFVCLAVLFPRFTLLRCVRAKCFDFYVRIDLSLCVSTTREKKKTNQIVLNCFELSTVSSHLKISSLLSSST